MKKGEKQTRCQSIPVICSLQNKELRKVFSQLNGREFVGGGRNGKKAPSVLFEEVLPSLRRAADEVP